MTRQAGCVRGLAVVAWLAGVLVAAAACKKEDSTPGMAAPLPDQFFRVVLSGEPPAAADVMVLQPANASKRTAGSPGSNPARLDAIATIYLGASTTQLTGSHDGRTTFNVKGGGWQLVGNIAGSSASGTYTGPGGRQGTFGGEDSASGAAERFCGSYDGTARGSWNVVVGKTGSASGAFGGGLTGTLSGSRTGNQLSLKWKATSGTGSGTATASIGEGGLSGQWTGMVDNQTVSGTFSSPGRTCPGSNGTAPAPSEGACACSPGQVGCLACGVCCAPAGDAGAFVPVVAPPPRDARLPDVIDSAPNDTREVGGDPGRPEVTAEVRPEAPPPDGPLAPGGIRVVVVNENGQPVPQASVIIRQGDRLVFQGTTGADGSVTRTELAPGSYTVYVDVAGYNPGQAPVEVPSGMTITVTARLVPADAVRNLTWTFIDECADNQGVSVRVYDRTTMTLWPAAESLPVASGQSAGVMFTCRVNADICYGARTTDGMTVYGVDVDGSKTCADCCAPCGANFEVKLVCATGARVVRHTPALPARRGAIELTTGLR